MSIIIYVSYRLFKLFWPTLYVDLYAHCTVLFQTSLNFALALHSAVATCTSVG